MIGEGEELFVVGDHEHFVLFIYPPVIAFPLFVVDVNHFGEELVLVGLVIGDVIVEGELESVFFLVGCGVAEEVTFDYFSEILKVFVLVDDESPRWFFCHLSYSCILL